MSGRPWAMSELDIIRKTEDITAKDVSKLLPGRTHIAIKHQREKLGLKFDWRGNTKYSIDHNFFGEPNLANCYWIDGDGSIFSVPNGHTISITGNRQVLQWINHFFDHHFPSINYRISSVHKRKRVYQYSISGCRVNAVVEKTTSLGLPVMVRKWNQLNLDSI